MAGPDWGFADIFNVMNAGTVTRVKDTYGANPATNAWFTPLTIMDGRYIRFGPADVVLM